MYIVLTETIIENVPDDKDTKIGSIHEFTKHRGGGNWVFRVNGKVYCTFFPIRCETIEDAVKASEHLKMSLEEEKGKDDSKI